MKKTHKVVMLPTEKKAQIYLTDKILSYYKIPQALAYNLGGQHLYIISDDAIKEGDWNLWRLMSGIGKEYDWNISQYYSKKSTQGDIERKKIVATTDKFLEIEGKCWCMKPERGGCIQCNKQLPQIPESFIPVYIKAYNEGKPITEVDLEMDCDHNQMPNKVIDIIKTRPDNTVIVHQSKQFTYQNALDFATWYSGMEQEKVKKQLDKWIQDNL